MAFEIAQDERVALPSTFPVNTRSFTIAFVMEASGTRDGYAGGNNTNPRAVWASPSNICNLSIARDGKFSVFDGASSASTETALYAPTSRSLVIMSAGPTGVTVYCNGASSTVAAFTAGTGTGGYFGGFQGATYPSQSTFYDVMAWNVALTTQNAADLLTWAQANRGVPSSYAYNLVVDGDSISMGVGSTLNRNWPRQMALPSNYRLTNRAEASAGIVTNGGSSSNAILANEAAAQVDPLVVPSKINILLLFAGTNDLVNGQTAAQVYSATVSYCQARKSAGWNKVIIVGMLPRQQSGLPANFESYRQSLRNSLLTDFSASTTAPLVYGPANNSTTYADAYVDLGGNQAIGQYAQSGQTLYFADGIHPTNAGATIIAGYVRAALVSVTSPVVLPAAANVRNNTDRGDGTLGTLVVPAASAVLAPTVFDNGTVGTASAGSRGLSNRCGWRRYGF